VKSFLLVKNLSLKNTDSGQSNVSHVLFEWIWQASAIKKGKSSFGNALKLKKLILNTIAIH